MENRRFDRLRVILERKQAEMSTKFPHRLSNFMFRWTRVS